VTALRIDVAYVDGAKGPVFLLVRRPVGKPVSTILVIPPFAEEMNKVRASITWLSNLLIENGFAVLVPDFYGTGDSAGDFEDACVETWIGDLQAVMRWSSNEGFSIDSALAVRLGSAILAETLRMQRLPPLKKTVLWQPVFDGERFMTQFLRLRTANAMGGGDAKITVADLRKQSASGAAVKVAGYDVSPQMMRDVDALRTPEVLPSEMGCVAWFEIVRDVAIGIPASTSKVIEASTMSGLQIQAQAFPGEPFWSSTEVIVNRAMVDTTVAAFADRA